MSKHSVDSYYQNPSILLLFCDIIKHKVENTRATMSTKSSKIIMVQNETEHLCTSDKPSRKNCNQALKGAKAGFFYMYMCKLDLFSMFK